MRRFLDELDSSDRLQAHAAELLRRGGPLRESELTFQRVRRSLDKPKRRRARLLLLRPAVVAVLVFGIAGVASGAWGVTWWMSPAVEEGDGTGEVGSRSLVPITRQPLAAAPQATLSAASEPDNAEFPAIKHDVIDGNPLEASSIGKETGTTERAPSRARERRHTKPSVQEKNPKLPNEADHLLIHRAVEALRTSNDPKLAARLLADYRERAIDGALAEEALALSIEAALANGDPRARALGQQYLARYPRGRFWKLASHAANAR